MTSTDGVRLASLRTGTSHPEGLRLRYRGLSILLWAFSLLPCYGLLPEARESVKVGNAFVSREVEWIRRELFASVDWEVRRYFKSRTSRLLNRSLVRFGSGCRQ